MTAPEQPTPGEAISFPSPGNVPYRGGCVTEPAFFALDHLVSWRADVTVAGQLYPQAPVLELLKAVAADPQGYGVSAEQARAAQERFLNQAGQALVQEGGQREWLEREF